ncbi:MAG: trypsin-like peptidase domain-containing protein [Luteolibacter sp.]|uniref:S1C family serine protease n=1 Tax=Luteolibacter sp. TaxID=1962973 RepID=UPI003263AEC7
MKFPSILPVLALLPWCAFADEGRPYVDDKKAPDSRQDLEAIQTALEKALPKARAATVCIEIKEGSGSGVIVSPEGLVLTAAHVATGVNKNVTVVLEDGTRLKAKTLGLVADKDAAMLQIVEKGTYPFVDIDKASTTRLGDWVFALGHSGGFDKERGSVVRLGRLVRIADSTIQSDCMLIGGDSGGPLFDLAGRMIGIHSRVGQQLQVNMHVPMSVYTENWDRMLKAEFIGEGPFAQLPEKGNGFLGLATEPRPEGGLRVTKVGSKSPAEEAGIKDGDIILKMNGTDLKTREQLQDLLKEMSAGDELTLETERNGEHKTHTLELGER